MILKKHGFHFTKALGQNFLTDEAVPGEIARLSGLNKDVGVIEIGAGMGTLTAALADYAKKVTALEIDKSLLPVLADTLKDFSNIEIINSDILKTDLAALKDEHFGDMPVFVCANLPYYITTPVIMYLLESKLPFEAITVMVQEEVARRLCANADTADYGSISVAVRYYTEPEIVLRVPKEAFVPMPKVNSAVVRMKIRKAPAVTISDEKDFFVLVRSAFAQRRKTFVNSVCNTLPALTKENVILALKTCGLSENIRGEALNIDEFARLSNILFKK